MLQIIETEKSISAWNFETIKEKLANSLNIYSNIVYTEDSIKSAKNDKADLAKAKKVIEDRRKEFKAQCMEPYNAIEPQIKELVAMIDEKRDHIDGIIKEYDERQKEQKKSEIKAYYDKKSHILGELAQPLFEKIFDKKWLNASTSKTKYQEELQAAINKAADDIKSIKSMNSPFEKTIIEKYTETLSIESAKEKHHELMRAAENAGLTTQSENPKPLEIRPSDTKNTAKNGITVRLYGNEGQLKQLFSFAKAIGIKIEII